MRAEKIIANKKKTYWLNADSLAHFWDDDSEWVINETDKSMIFKCIKKWTYQDDDAPMLIKCRKDNKCNHCLKDHWDWTYTIYMYRDWQPLYFVPKQENA